MRIRMLRSRIYRLNPANPSAPVYIGGCYIKTGGLSTAHFRALVAALGILGLAALITAGVYGAKSALYALSYLPCVRLLFAALFMPHGEDPLREDDFHTSVRTVRFAGAAGALIGTAAAVTVPLCAHAAAAMLAACVFGYRQRYLLQQTETTR